MLKLYLINEIYTNTLSIDADSSIMQPLKQKEMLHQMVQSQNLGGHMASLCLFVWILLKNAKDSADIGLVSSEGKKKEDTKTMNYSHYESFL